MIRQPALCLGQLASHIVTLHVAINTDQLRVPALFQCPQNRFFGQGVVAEIHQHLRKLPGHGSSTPHGGGHCVPTVTQCLQAAAAGQISRLHHSPAVDLSLKTLHFVGVQHPVLFQQWQQLRQRGPVIKSGIRPL